MCGVRRVRLAPFPTLHLPSPPFPAINAITLCSAPVSGVHDVVQEVCLLCFRDSYSSNASGHRLDKGSFVEVVRSLDFPTLMAFRAVSRDCMSIVTAVLKSDLKQLLRLVAADVDLFLYALDEMEGFIGGYAALSFFQRLRLHPSLPVEIFVPRLSFTPMISHLQHLQGATLLDTSLAHDLTTSCVVATSTFVLDSTVLLLHASVSEAPLLPVARLSNTALLCYVGARHYGVLWPRLTFASRGLVGDDVAQSELHDDALNKVGVDTKLYAWMWPVYGAPQRCASASFLCPAQPRFFTDRGALRVSWEPLGNTEDMDCDICYRMDDRPCGGACLSVHQYLRSGRKRFCVL